eukprot:TRINITY_DN2799_c0_g1_i1.p1 TRINITY_DN2799_c0_g1~~TRINITY_DN2799_c0_g1_i1.p1  ORF type:complete len:473 (+),score=115.28 TRINITY_DN2799_c0_g1_i1:26-1444(+)
MPPLQPLFRVLLLSLLLAAFAVPAFARCHDQHHVRANVTEAQLEKLSDMFPFQVWTDPHPERAVLDSLDSVPYMRHLYVSGEVLSFLEAEQRDAVEVTPPSVLHKRDVHDADPFDFTHYHHYESLTLFLQRVVEQFPDITRLFSIGQSVEGRELWVLEISDNPGQVEEDEPEFKYVGNMHGDEVIGREMLLRLIHVLLHGYYEVGDADIQYLVENTRIFIMPSMNPDGFERHQRENANNYDLNRDFPDRITGHRGSYFQPEVEAMMAWSEDRHFIISANLHGGSIVANYPWDGNESHRSGQYSACPDDDVFKQLALAYANGNPTMKRSREFPGGITNGAMWYTLYGGMQDWNYLHTSDFELTIEMSNIKWPPANQLNSFWLDNDDSLMELIHQVHMGVRGRVTDSRGEAVPDAFIDVEGIDHPVRTDSIGWFYRPLVSGTYNLSARSEDGTRSAQQEVTVGRAGFVYAHFSV